MPSAPPGGQRRARGELDVLFVDTWWTEEKKGKNLTVKARADQKGALPAPPPTWGVLGGGQRGHGVGQVQVGSDAELALAAWGVGGGGRAQLLLPPLLLGRGQVAVDQRLQELDDQLGVVGDLRLLKAQEESDPRRRHVGVASRGRGCAAEGGGAATLEKGPANLHRPLKPKPEKTRKRV